MAVETLREGAAEGEDESACSIFDTGKKTGYVKKPPKGESDIPVVSWGYSMNAVPPPGRRPSIDSHVMSQEWSHDFLKEEERAEEIAWKLHKVTIDT